MSGKIYTTEEKIAYIEKYINSDKGSTTFSKENEIPESTFRGWIKDYSALDFGTIEIKNNANLKSNKNIMVFASENIRIELKENFEKEFLKKIVEVLIYDK